MRFQTITGAVAAISLFLAACGNNSNQDTTTSVIDTTIQPVDTAMPTLDPSVVVTDTMQKSNVPGTAKKTRKVMITTKPYAVNKKEKMEADVSGIYPYSEVMPSFPGGEKALADWLEKNINYPEAALENDTEGDVVLAFYVDESGKVYTPTVISKKLGDGLEEEAINVVSKMPNWNPGRIKGKNVKTKFTLPISFQLQ